MVEGSAPDTLAALKRLLKITPVTGGAAAAIADETVTRGG